jgi:hypothetical protein
MLILAACAATGGTVAAQPAEPPPPTHDSTAGSYMTSPNARTNTTDNSRLGALLPEGVSSEAACRGINSLRLCAATLHAAQNLNVSFTDLKRKVEAGDRLSAAIHTLKPNVDAGAEERRLEDQALSNLQEPRG